eukprot:2362363-Heterocapsa_arctica.AAC.1
MSDLRLFGVSAVRLILAFRLNMLSCFRCLFTFLRIRQTALHQTAVASPMAAAKALADGL